MLYFNTKNFLPYFNQKIHSYIAYIFFLDLYPSKFEERQNLESLVDVFDYFHGNIGEQMYKDRSKSNLVENGVFVYDHFYYILTNR